MWPWSPQAYVITGARVARMQVDKILRRLGVRSTPRSHLTGSSRQYLLRPAYAQPIFLSSHGRRPQVWPLDGFVRGTRLLEHAHRPSPGRIARGEGTPGKR